MADPDLERILAELLRKRNELASVRFIFDEPKSPSPPAETFELTDIPPAPPQRPEETSS